MRKELSLPCLPIHFKLLPIPSTLPLPACISSPQSRSYAKYHLPIPTRISSQQAKEPQAVQRYHAAVEEELNYEVQTEWHNLEWSASETKREENIKNELDTNYIVKFITMSNNTKTKAPSNFPKCPEARTTCARSLNCQQCKSIWENCLQLDQQARNILRNTKYYPRVCSPDRAIASHIYCSSPIMTSNLPAAFQTNRASKRLGNFTADLEA
jgi:hypothetical protein